MDFFLRFLSQLEWLVDMTAWTPSKLSDLESNFVRRGTRRALYTRGVMCPASDANPSQLLSRPCNGAFGPSHIDRQTTDFLFA